VISQIPLERQGRGSEGTGRGTGKREGKGWIGEGRKGKENRDPSPSSFGLKVALLTIRVSAGGKYCQKATEMPKFLLTSFMTALS